MIMTKTQSLKSLCNSVKISSKFGASLAWDKQDSWQQQAHGYTVTLRYQGRQMTTDFWLGPAISGEPEVENVIDCLLSDAMGSDQSFEEFCAEFGYDTDSRKAEATYKACKKSGEKLRRLLGDDFETFAYSDRN